MERRTLVALQWLVNDNQTAVVDPPLALAADLDDATTLYISRSLLNAFQCLPPSFVIHVCVHVADRLQYRIVLRRQTASPISPHLSVSQGRLGVRLRQYSLIYINQSVKTWNPLAMKGDSAQVFAKHTFSG